ncbi:hypothetical protein AMTRI_Chr11g95490 [Amborella trichopoda]|uniref:Late embryogenesis abundant protein LEA-2 subgroup domain-containing protein n=1 Tax=Amborella trichopoda TaxID=13333 RepID=U5D719_AMBTC|nr:NDR1/HIN1-like protein 3 [Amborella trichopoda]ERN16148.1 hypothetical protein AMTR_s00030p00216100 [Amborella trichopoda]|eukprot:XP_006854681.1 NDR1/HIN1-like protein 3 [Amborella trichopoda]
MADAKGAHFNGAYYGAPQGVTVPPPQAYHRPPRGKGCGPCCILTGLIKLAVAIVVTLGIVALVVWLVLRPNKVKFYAENASLTQFNLSGTNNLQYNLQLDISIRNPNKRIGIYYDKVDAMAYYEGERFGWAPLPAFYQGHKNTTVIQPKFTGQQLLLLNSHEVAQFGHSTSQGFFYIDVKLYLRVRFKVGSFKIKTKRFSPEIECDLRIPLGSNSTTGFSRKRCDIDYW